MYDVIVIGGGLLGSAVAYHLVQQNVKTLLIDRHDEGRATDAGAGILGPESGTNDRDDWFELAIPAVAYYPTLVAQLTALSAGDTGYAPCGKITAAFAEDELPAFQRAKKLIFARQKERGLPADEDLHLISPTKVWQRFPILIQPIGKAIYQRNAARVDGKLLAQALQVGAKKLGLHIKEMSVDSLLINGGQVEGVTCAGEVISGGKVVIAGGAWSQTFAEQLGLEIPVEPQRGQILHLHLPGYDTAGWPIISAFHGHYILPWPDGKIIVGATREYGPGYAPHLTVGGVHEVLREAIRLAPKLRQAHITEFRVGLRPRSADRLPVLGPVPTIKGVYLATGHGSTGLQLGPYSAKLLADLIAGQTPELDLSPYLIDRFL